MSYVGLGIWTKRSLEKLADAALILKAYKTLDYTLATPEKFPGFIKNYQEACEKMGITKPPDVYIVNSDSANSFALPSNGKLVFSSAFLAFPDDQMKAMQTHELHHVKQMKTHGMGVFKMGGCAREKEADEAGAKAYGPETMMAALEQVSAKEENNKPIATGIASFMDDFREATFGIRKHCGLQERIENLKELKTPEPLAPTSTLPQSANVAPTVALKK